MNSYGTVILLFWGFFEVLELWAWSLLWQSLLSYQEGRLLNGQYLHTLTRADGGIHRELKELRSRISRSSWNAGRLCE